MDKPFKIFGKNALKEDNYFRANFKAESTKEEKLKIFLNNMKRVREDRKEQSNNSMRTDKETNESGGEVFKRSKSSGRGILPKYEGSPTRSKSTGREMLSKYDKNLNRSSRELFTEFNENEGKRSSFTKMLKKERSYGCDKFQDRVGRNKSRDRNNIPVITWRSRSRDRQSRVSSSPDRFARRPREMSCNHCSHREIACNHYSKKEIPCKHYNHQGYCLYDSGHLNFEGFAKIHVCGKCFYGKGGARKNHPEIDCPMRRNPESNSPRRSHPEIGFPSRRHPEIDSPGRNHPEIDCPRRRNMERDYPKRNHPEIDKTRSKLSCPRGEEPCTFFNNVGNCAYKSGHSSKCGQYSQVHVCRFCLLEFGKKLFHSAVDCWYKNNSVEKPCIHFNNTGDCPQQSGHFNESGFVKQLHICRRCLETNNKIQYHPAIDCRLKDALGDLRREKAVVGAREETGYDEKPTRASGRHSHHNMGRQSGLGARADVQTDHRGRSDVQTDHRGRSDVQTDNRGRSEVQTDHRGRSEVQTDHRGRSDVQTDNRGRSEVQTDNRGRSDVQTDSRCRFDYREEKNEGKASQSRTLLSQDVQPEERKNVLAVGGKAQDEIKQNGSTIDIKRKLKLVKSNYSPDVEQTENKSEVNKTHNSTPKKSRNITQKIRDLNSEEDNDADDESDQVDLSIHMNPEERFPDEGDMKVVKHSIPAKIKKTSSTLIDHIVRVTKEKIENIEGKIKVLENREKLRSDVDKKITEASVGGDKQYEMSNVSPQHAALIADGTGGNSGSTSTVNNGGTDNAQADDHLPRDLPNQTGKKDSVLEQEEIMLRIELLQKLHVSWSRKLREARQQGENPQSNHNVDCEAGQQGELGEAGQQGELGEAGQQGEVGQPNGHVENPSQEVDQQ